MKRAAVLGAFLLAGSAVHAATFAELIAIDTTGQQWLGTGAIIGPLPGELCQQQLVNFARGILSDLPETPGTVGMVVYKQCVEASDITQVDLTPMNNYLCRFLRQFVILGTVNGRRFLCEFPPPPPAVIIDPGTGRPSIVNPSG